MHVPTLAAAGLLTLATLAPAAHAQSAGAPYKALGTEPFWSLTISPQTMRFEAPDRPTVTVPTPAAINGFAGEIYRTRRVNVNIVHKPCSDGMSDRVYRDTVQVSVDGRSYKGCGGGSTEGPQVSAIEGEWRIATIAGRPPVARSQPTIAFRGDRITGNTGCNSFNGSFRSERGRITAGPLATTRRACSGAANAQEQSLLRLLGQRLSVATARGRTVLTAGNGQTIVLTRAASGPVRR